MVVDNMREKGISPLSLLNNHTAFYERCGQEFLCRAQGDGEEELSRMYIRRQNISDRKAFLLREGRFLLIRENILRKHGSFCTS